MEEGAETITTYFPPGKWYDIEVKGDIYFNQSGVEYGFYQTIKTRFD